MMLTFRYIAGHYLKFFFVILSALVFFMVGFDYMANADKLPSANLSVIYLVFKSFFAVDMMLPLALVFAMIATKISLIRSNALVALYALGYSKTDVLRPFVVISSTIIAIYISLHATPFARADEYSNNIRSSATYLRPTTNLFFTYEESYVYFGKLFPLQERAEDIRIFRMYKDTLRQVMVADDAYYTRRYWHIPKAQVMTKPLQLSIESRGIERTEQEALRMLKDFRPKILDQVHEGKVNYTIIDAIDALLLFNQQNINVDKIKSALYRIFISPLFVPSLIVVIFFFVPINPRFVNVTLFGFGAVLATMITWAILFILTELSNNKTISSEVGIILPVVILFIASVTMWHHNAVRKKHTSR